MAVEGRDIDVLFPSILLGGSGSNQYRNLPLVSAVCRAYNSWLATTAVLRQSASSE